MGKGIHLPYFYIDSVTTGVLREHKPPKVLLAND